MIRSSQKLHRERNFALSTVTTEVTEVPHTSKHYTYIAGILVYKIH